MWNDPNAQRGDYDTLMKDVVKADFKGFFTEIDAQDISKISMDIIISHGFLLSFPKLPFNFFIDYFNYLHRENPKLAKDIDSPESLEEKLRLQSATKEGIHKKEERNFKRIREKLAFLYEEKKD